MTAVMSSNQAGYLPAVTETTRSGLTASEWDQLIASRTGPGVNAPRAAQALSGSYLSKRDLQGTGRGHSSWQKEISQCSAETGLNAGQCAHDLSVAAGRPRTRSRSRSRSRSPSPAYNGSQGCSRSIYGSTSPSNYHNATNYHGTSTYNGSRSPSKYHGASKYHGTSGYPGYNVKNYGKYDGNLTQNELGGTIAGGKISGLDREGRQALISECSRLTGKSATECSHDLSKYYEPRRSRYTRGTGDQPGTWQNAIKTRAIEQHIPANRAAQQLSFRANRPVSSSTFNPTSLMDRSMGPLLSNRQRGGSPLYSGDEAMDLEDAVEMEALADVRSGSGYIRDTSAPDNRSYLVASDLRAVAQQLGLSPEGDNQSLVQRIRRAVHGLEPQAQQSALQNIQSRARSGPFRSQTRSASSQF